MKDLLIVDGEPVEWVTEGEALLLHAQVVAQKIQQRVREAVGAPGPAAPDVLARDAGAAGEGGQKGAEA